jgi:hypothetical protein
VVYVLLVSSWTKKAVTNERERERERETHTHTHTEKLKEAYGSFKPRSQQTYKPMCNVNVMLPPMTDSNSFRHETSKCTKN